MPVARPAAARREREEEQDRGDERRACGNPREQGASKTSEGGPRIPVPPPMVKRALGRYFTTPESGPVYVSTFDVPWPWHWLHRFA